MSRKSKSGSKKTSSRSKKSGKGSSGYNFGGLKRVKISSVAVYAIKPI